MVNAKKEGKYTGEKYYNDQIENISCDEITISEGVAEDILLNIFWIFALIYLIFCEFIIIMYYII